MITKEKIVFARKVHCVENHFHLLSDSNKIQEMHKNISEGDIYIARSVIPKQKVLEIRKYLTGIGQYSLPNYRKIEVGCPNFHRINLWDKRSYVQACFHQFVFFPWNQNLFNFFELTKEVYYMKNLLSNVRKDKFLSPEPEDGCIARLAFQFYPKGNGAMNKHCDPVDYHQLTVPVMVMSKKGVDFNSGGAYVETKEGKKILLEDFTEIGDVIYFNAQTPHGVEMIDSGSDVDWLSFEGRWMLLFAVNKLFDNNEISNSIDLEKL